MLGLARRTRWPGLVSVGISTVQRLGVLRAVPNDRLGEFLPLRDSLAHADHLSEKTSGSPAATR
ncbi:hypothetical protein HSBGL_0859 [Halapricum desulfuricans]|uniref:Uncharacterized protein n=1 Tax=Halapricum desulfuricans TaxID=2841257 RepID=A0A897NK96_9EURY|nr:hypothetical protein HSBGL_0859 [Halapricum desulfuricans]